MALSTPRIIGRDLTVTCDGVKTVWNTFSITLSDNTEGATASDSTEDEVVRTTKMLAGTCTGLAGAANNGATLPMPGDVIADLAVAKGADSVLPSLAGYTNIKVISVKYDAGPGPVSWSFDFRSGVLN